VADFWAIFQIPNFKSKSELTDENSKTTVHRMRPVVLTHLPDFHPVYRTSGNITACGPENRGYESRRLNSRIENRSDYHILQFFRGLVTNVIASRH
jgi:hypothetical protein